MRNLLKNQVKTPKLSTRKGKSIMTKILNSMGKQAKNKDQLSMVVLGSGSRGNAYYIWNRDTAVLIDCGLSTKQIFERLEQIGILHPKIDAVFVTHEHTDHVSSCAILEKRLNRLGQQVEFFMSPGTFCAAPEKCLPSSVSLIRDLDTIKIGSVLVEAFEVPHDGTECLGYRVGYNGHWVGVITDLGDVTDVVIDKMRTMTTMAFEFNHDVDMLQNGSYPLQVQERILDWSGHLSNEQAAEALRKSVSPRLQHLILAHISEQNNCPKLAEKMARDVLERSFHTDIVHLHVAEQHRPSPIFTVNEAPKNILPAMLI
jgi:phosphoribosyl 1,2-cyclic phosphodiesterase